ncbi:MAG TPA: phosphoribosylglycinamide formyltransferase [Bacillota bacterium]|nr:phosphoribosylglycinamide formyltransferase [Bacillota bacterium]
MIPADSQRDLVPCRLAVLVSGSGSTLQALIDSIRTGELPAEIAVVISSRREVAAPDRARRYGIPVHIVRPRDFATPEEYDRDLCSLLEQVRPDLVVLAGYLSILGQQVMKQFGGRIMNIHPSLLPSFGGKGCFGHNVHRQVLEYGCKLSGATVMFVDNTLDTGPIILQEAIEVRDDDTVESLARRVGEVERRLYPVAIRLFAEDRLRVEGRRVCISTRR